MSSNFSALTFDTLSSIRVFSVLLSIHFLSTDLEKLFDNDNLLQLVIGFLILTTLVFDSAVML